MDGIAHIKRDAHADSNILCLAYVLAEANKLRPNAHVIYGRHAQSRVTLSCFPSAVQLEHSVRQHERVLNVVNV